MIHLATHGLSPTRPVAQRTFPKKFDSTRYLGKWYEVVRMPTPAQATGTLATAEYTAGEKDGEVIVKNSAYTADGKLIAAIEGKALLLPNDPPRLAVGFGPVVPKDPNYFVIHVDEDYNMPSSARPIESRCGFLRGRFRFLPGRNNL